MTTKAKTKLNDGMERFVPLNKLKKSPKHARKVPHTEAAIATLAASIAYKGCCRISSRSRRLMMPAPRRSSIWSRSVRGGDWPNCCARSARSSGSPNRSVARSIWPTIRPRLAWMRTLPARTCTRPISTRCSAILRRRRDMASRKSRPGSVSRRMSCASGCGCHCVLRGIRRA